MRHICRRTGVLIIQVYKVKIFSVWRPNCLRILILVGIGVKRSSAKPGAIRGQDIKGFLASIGNINRRGISNDQLPSIRRDHRPNPASRLEAVLKDRA